MVGEAFWNTGTSSGTTDTLSDLASVRLTDVAMHWSIVPYGNPQGVWDETTQRTWIAYLATGGDVYATYYDHTDGTIATPVLVGAYPFPVADYHHVPTAMLDGDGRMHIIYSGHLTGEPHRHYRMTNPRDLSAWTVQSLEDGTYVFGCTTDDGEMIFTDRPSGAHGSSFPAHEYGAIHRSTNGTTWTRTEIIDTTGTPEAESDFYQGDLLWADGKVHLIWTVARGVHDGDKSAIYYAAYDPATSTLSAADGTSLGATITWTDHASCLVASVTTTDRIRSCMAWHRGRPVIAHWTTDEADIVVTEWTGSAWESAAVGSASGEYLPCLVSTPDELVLLTHGDLDGAGRPVELWRRIDGEWTYGGRLLDTDGANTYTNLTPVRDGPAIALTMSYDRSGGWPGNDDTVTGPLALITRPLTGSGATYTLEPEDVRDAGRWEVVVSGTPAEAVTTEDETDWLYAWTTE